ncbi:RdgB/HAM1 family non-canonical purine NTP pyrophosphatase [Szabonella alba]|uniref:dITP/XTP pyrophosphatase n=1 Tax=Szabonella alba TaxID=2804194 RepID=A0A8K0Y0D4_9RHOB|nr:RdgB/HAM1 family non-canonical purine NTP pyrophosphatase [Szabonella alba]MBL4916712.1 RdgB/HAM1 family non-canonical purine NTP pyrophosphatase [Szabonella alba]
MRKFAELKLLIATHNAGKLEEMADLLKDFGIKAISAGQLSLAEPEETEDSFIGNARIKAHAAAAASGLVALADDSGLCVDALGGDPGVRTADWAEGPGGRNFHRAMERTWTALEAVSAPHPRRATFRCTLVMAWPDGHDEVFEGGVSGHLIWPPRGDLGHGYDPMFVPDGHDRTFGEMDRWAKNRMSHRFDAFSKLAAGCFT